MTRRFMLAVTLAAAAMATLFLGGASTARAASVSCTGAIGGGGAVTTINGDVIVANHASCTLSFVTVTGNVQVQSGGSLVIAAYGEPSTINGSLQATHCGSVLLEGNVAIDGDVLIQSCSGTEPNGFQGPGVVIKGDFTCKSNSAPCVAWLGDVGGSLQVLSNVSATPSDISLTTIGGELQCNANRPSPTHSHGFDWGDAGARTGHGQCADFVTTTTTLSPPVTPVTSCAALASLPSTSFPVPNTVITSAVDTPADATLPERCVINGVVNARTSPVDKCTYGDSFQVQLPLPSAWNHRFMFQGGGGTEGSVPTATGTDSGSAGSNFGIINGYAAASQDGGHENSQLAKASCDSGFGNPNEFYLDPMATIDYAYQSIQVTTLVAKYLIDEYYGDGPAHTYWVGCSTGGRQGMVMSQNFPQYFDGIAAGDPVYDLEAIGSSSFWGIQQIYDLAPASSYTVEPGPPPEAGEPILYNNFPVSDQTLFETALLQACDALDGVADGVIDDLAGCKAKFDPETATYTSAGMTYTSGGVTYASGGTTQRLQCTGPKNATCLSPAQIRAVKNINLGPRTSAGLPVFAPAGATAPDGAPARDNADNLILGYAYDAGFMTTVGIPARKIGGPTSAPADFTLSGTQFPYAFMSPPAPTFDVLTFNFSTDQHLYSRSTPVISLSTSLDISKYVNYGHKIIWYHGLSDPGPPVLGTILYYNQMAAQHGGLQEAQKFSRLYPVPNMDHCTSGATTDQFDMLTPLVNWVEHGTAPGPVTAKGVNFNATTFQVGFVSGSPDNAPTTRSRLLCPYPQEARFTGSVTKVNGVPVAANPADLGVAANYKCVTPPEPYFGAPPYPSERGPFPQR